jgi:hypothetical protein
MLATERYTLSNTLQWGLFRAHYEKASENSSTGSKILHITLAALEALPILSQLVSLVEYAVASIFLRLSTATIPKEPPVAPKVDVITPSTTTYSCRAKKEVNPESVTDVCLPQEVMTLPGTVREVAKRTEEMHKEVTNLSKKITETTANIDREGKAFISTLDIDLYVMRKAANDLKALSSTANVIVETGASAIESEIKTFTELKASFSTTGIALLAKDAIKKALEETVEQKIPTIERYRKQLMEQHELVKKALVDLRARQIVVENLLLTARTYNERLTLEANTLTPKGPTTTS